MWANPTTGETTPGGFAKGRATYRIHSNYGAKKINLGHGLALKLECKITLTCLVGLKLGWCLLIRMKFWSYNFCMLSGDFEVSFGGVVRVFKHHFNLVLH